MNSILLKNANIVHADGEIVKAQDILIEEGRIKEIGKLNTGTSKTIDLSNRYISPSFVNLHTHSAMNIFKGFAEDVNIDEWFNKRIWPYEARLKELDVYHGSKLAIAEMQNAGVSAFADHYLYPEAIIKVAIEMNMDLDIAPTLFSGEEFQKGLDETIELYNKYKYQDGIIISLGPHSTYTVNKKDLESLVPTRDKYSFKTHIHVSETKEQVQESKSLYGKTPIAILKETEILRGRTIIGHGLYVEEDDLIYLNGNVIFALSPKTYFKLNMGFGNILFFKDRLNIGIGTDGAASSNTLNPLEQARLLGLMGKYILKDGEKFNIKEIWKYLMNGHKFLEFNSGEIKEGFSADLIVWNLDKPNTLPNTDPLASIIYSASNENIESVMIRGNFVKQDNLLVNNIEESAVYCKNLIDNLIELGGEEKSRKF
ncbi:MAG: amidohydrolase family protein [Gudongella sp.]|nr:amidohydrolase family protein [Gudongella sp.]